MRAKFIYEFERGLEPEKALKIGKYSKLIYQIKEIIKDEFDYFILSYKLTSNLDSKELEFVIWDTTLYVGLPNLTSYLSTNVTYISTLFQEFFSSGEGEQKLDDLLKFKFGKVDYMYPDFLEYEPEIYMTSPIFAIDFNFNLKNLNEFERRLDSKSVLNLEISKNR